MARIIVTPDEQSDVVLFDEHVYPIHLDNELSSLQVAERLARLGVPQPGRAVLGGHDQLLEVGVLLRELLEKTIV